MIKQTPPFFEGHKEVDIAVFSFVTAPNRTKYSQVRSTMPLCGRQYCFTMLLDLLKDSHLA